MSARLAEWTKQIFLAFLLFIGAALGFTTVFVLAVWMMGLFDSPTVGGG